MPTEKKISIVKELVETIARSNIIVLADFRGVPASRLTTLRRRLKGVNSELRVVKNTLSRLAAKESGKEELVKSLVGPTAITFGYGDISAPVKALVTYQYETEGFSIKSGLLGNKIYGKEQIMTLATLPSREVLLGRVLGQMNAPISLFVGALASPIRGFVGILQARINQLEAK
jgi:large subunit ribosomal protein L10